MESATMKLRPATPDDAPALARIHIAGLAAAYGGLVPQEFLDTLNLSERTDNWTTWLSSGETTAIIAHDDAGNPAGFIGFGKLRTAPPGMSPVRPTYTSEIYALYILPDYWRLGLGRELMTAAALALRDRKQKSLCLWVLEKNPRAVPFYKALGGQKCGTKMVEIGGRTVPEIAFGWRDTAVLLTPRDLPVHNP
jgi:ribosomal protein S18 acetylase RimI-like enzyme